MVAGDLVFGFLPQSVLSDFDDVGNWKNRAVAVDRLQRALMEVPDKAVLLPHLPALVAFLQQLLSDHNWKVAISGMQLIGELARGLGRPMQSQLSTVVPALVLKFDDPKPAVASTALRTLRRLMAAATSPQAVLDLMAPNVQRSGSCKVREHVVDAHILALLVFTKEQLEMARITRTLLATLSDTDDRVRRCAMEGLALLSQRQGPAQLQPLLRAAGASEVQVALVLQRTSVGALPTLTADGAVQHMFDDTQRQEDTSSGMQEEQQQQQQQQQGQQDAYAGRVMMATPPGKLPWEVPLPRPRSRTQSGTTPSTSAPAGLGSTGLSSTAGATEGGLLNGLGSALPLRSAISCLDGMSKASTATGAGSSNRFLSDLAGYQQLQGSGGSIASRMDVPPPAALNGSIGAMGVDGAQRGPRAWELAGLRASQDSLVLRGSADSLEDSLSNAGSGTPGAMRGSAGSPMGRGSSQADWGHDSTDVLLPKSRFYGGEEGPPLGGLITSSSHAAQQQLHSTAMANGTSNGAAVYDNFRYLSPNTSPSGSLSAPGAKRLPGDTDRAASHESASSSGSPAGMRPLWLDAPGAGALEPGSPVNRPETFSPNRGERLANLKRRQQEKRAVTASSCSRGQDSIGSIGSDGFGAAVDDFMQYGDPVSSGGSLPGGPPLLVWSLPGKPGSSPAGSGALKHSGGRSGGLSAGHASGAAMAPHLRAAAAFHEEQQQYKQEEARQQQQQHSYQQASSQQPQQPPGQWGLKQQEAVGGLDWGVQRAAAASSMRPPHRTASAASAGATSDSLRAPTLQGPLRMGLQTHLGRTASDPSICSTSSAAPNPGPSRYGRIMSADSPTPPGSDCGSPSNMVHPQLTAVVTRRRPATGDGADSGGGGGTPSGRFTPGTPTTPSSGGKSALDKGAEDISHADLTSLPDPEASVRRVIGKLQSSNIAKRIELDWLGQLEALNDARRLVKHHMEVLRPALHEFVLAAVPSIDQLRSSTVKVSMLLFQEMFAQLGRGMDKELDEIVPTLAKRAGEVSTAGKENFISLEADRTMSIMCRYVSEARALSSLIAVAGHKSPTVRAKIASHLDEVLEGGQARGSLLANWALTEKLFRTAAAFLEEGSLECRVYGKRIIWEVRSAVANRSDWERLLSAVRPEALQRKVLEVVDSGIGPPPPPSRGSQGSRLAPRGSAPSSPCSPSSRDGSAASNSGAAPRRALFSNSSGRLNADGAPNTPPHEGRGDSPGSAGQQQLGPLSAMAAARRRRTSGEVAAGAQQPAVAPEVAAEVDRVLGQLSSKDWRDRSNALRDVDAMLVRLQGFPDSLLMAVMEGLAPRLSDGNAKVLVQALETLTRLFPVVRDRVLLGVNTLVPALAATLGSTNEKVRAEAQCAIDSLVASAEPALLVQNLCHVLANGGASRGRGALVEKLQSIVPQVYRYKPQLVVKHVLPAAFALLNEGRGDLRSTSGALLVTLAHLMGPALLDHIGNLSAPLQQKVRETLFASAGTRR